MAITGVNAYNSVYENVYATKQKETKETSTTQKKTDTENKSSLLNQLQDKYSNFDIIAGTFSKNQISSSSKGFQGVMISSAYLREAENDEAAAKDLDEMLSGVESAYNWLKNACARDGLELVSCGYYIDENGKMGSWSVVEKKSSMFDGLTEQNEKSTDRIKAKQEKIREQKKADKKKAEEKQEKAELEEKRQANREEKEKLQEKLDEIGREQFGDKWKDMVIIENDDENAAVPKADKANTAVTGLNMDLRV